MAYLHCRCDRPDRHIVDYTVHVNRLNDLVLRGACSACGGPMHIGPVGRYLETGEDPKRAERIKAILRERKRKEWTRSALAMRLLMSPHKVDYQDNTSSSVLR